MRSWTEFEKDDPMLASFGCARLNDGVAYLATVRSDGSPRVHPVTTRIREGRYALHSQVLDTSGAGGEFAVSGHARLVDDPVLLQALTHGLLHPDRYVVFELQISGAMSTIYDEHDRAIRQRWP